jgi:hypothetical protein
MSENINKNIEIVDKAPKFINRVLRHDSTRRGLAAAGAGVLIAVITEAIWPTRS